MSILILAFKSLKAFMILIRYFSFSFSLFDKFLNKPTFVTILLLFITFTLYLVPPFQLCLPPLLDSPRPSYYFCCWNTLGCSVVQCISYLKMRGLSKCSTSFKVRSLTFDKKALLFMVLPEVNLTS